MGVIYQDDPALIAEFLAQRGSWGPTLEDPDGRVAIAYGVFGPPETFFIDRKGTIHEKVIGMVHPEQFVRIVEELL